MIDPTLPEVYLGLQRLKLYFQQNFPFKHTYYEGTVDPRAGAGLLAPVGALYAQKAGTDLVATYIKQTTADTGWEVFGAGGTGSGVSLWTPNTAYTTFADTSVPALIWEAASAKFYYNLADFTSEATFEADQLLGRWLELSPAGGASLVPWDLTPVSAPAYLTITPFPPELPFANQAVIVGDTISLTAANVGTNAALGSFPNIPATGKYYFYFRFGATTGTYDMVSQQIGLDTLNEDGGSGGFTFDGGLAATSLNDTTVVDPLFAIGDVACAYIDADANTIGVITPNGNFPSAISVPSGLGGLTLDALLLIDISTGSASSTMDMSATDLGSGIVPPVGYSLYGGTTQAGLPVDAVEGDHLKVTVGGTYNSVEYAVDDLAVVLDAGTGTVFPVGEKSVPVPAATWVESYVVTVGVDGQFPDFQALMLDIEDNKRQGDTLGITFTGTVLAENDKLLRVPSFKKITLKAPAPMTPPADPNFVFTLDGFANEYIELQGEIRAPYINGFNVVLVPLDLTGQTGLRATVSYNLNGVYGAKVTEEGDPYPYIRCGTSTGAVIRDVGNVRGYTAVYTDTSKLELGFTNAYPGVALLFGNIGGIINTNSRISFVNAQFSIVTLKNISLSNISGVLVTAASGSYGRIINLECGTAGVGTVLNADGAAVHVTNITGTYTKLVNTGRLVNVYTKEGGIFYEGLPNGDTPPVPSLSSVAGVLTVDLSLSDYYKVAVTEDITSIVFTNASGGNKPSTKMFEITQGTTPRTVTWPASFKWEGAAPVVSDTASAVDLLAITTFEGGVGTWHGTLSKGRV